MLVCARLQHVAGTQWGTRRYMNMDHLTQPEDELLSDIIASWSTVTKRLKLFLRKNLDTICPIELCLQIDSQIQNSNVEESPQILFDLEALFQPFLNTYKK